MNKINALHSHIQVFEEFKFKFQFVKLIYFSDGGIERGCLSQYRFGSQSLCERFPEFCRTCDTYHCNDFSREEIKNKELQNDGTKTEAYTITIILAIISLVKNFVR